MTDKKDRIVAKAVAYTLVSLKVLEKNHNNRGDIVEELLKQADGKPGMPWCVATANFIYQTTCKMLGVQPLFNLGVSSSEFVKKAKKIGKIIPASKVEDGDFVVYEGDDYGTGYIHTAFVFEKPDKNGNYFTIEGNSDDTVQKRKRNLTASPAVFIRLLS